MNAKQFQAAVKLAKSDTDLSQVVTFHLFGCGLKSFKPVEVTIEQVAAFIRYQAKQWDGEMDNAALAECRDIAREKFVCREFTNDQIDFLRQKAREAINEAPYVDGKTVAQSIFEDFFVSMGIRFDN